MNKTKGKYVRARAASLPLHIHFGHVIFYPCKVSQFRSDLPFGFGFYALPEFSFDFNLLLSLAVWFEWLRDRCRMSVLSWQCIDCVALRSGIRCSHKQWSDGKCAAESLISVAQRLQRALSVWLASNRLRSQKTWQSGFGSAFDCHPTVNWCENVLRDCGPE